MDKRIDQNKITTDAEKLPYPWFGVNHGIDNYEQAILLTEIVWFNTSIQYLSGNKMQTVEDQKDHALWSYNVKACLKNGQVAEIPLTPRGYDSFLKALMNLKKHTPQ